MNHNCHRSAKYRAKADCILIGKIYCGYCGEWLTAEALNILFNELFIKHEEVCDYKPETSHKYKKIIGTILSMSKKARLVDDNYATADYIHYPSRKKIAFRPWLMMRLNNSMIVY